MNKRPLGFYLFIGIGSVLMIGYYFAKPYLEDQINRSASDAALTKGKILIGVDNWIGPYLKRKDIPVDPWGNAYHYRSPGENGDYDLYSFGRDKADGGEGEDEDIVSW